ncbi:hypothetical protein L5515_005933 [Caenorhabditis briggsae]|uniref:Glycoprotein hormone subunit beta domain-containing protein n=1 Tax=Caenorhabditis briggsae TaxID=6238 RepID=A0AAE9JHJ5_CAEBR|nr:hypothetical protein L5515_005933 [Caenorhabditis briggsae]
MLLLPVFTVLQIFLISVESGKECEFAMRLVPGFNPLVQKDAAGKECRGNVELPFCKGYCKTSESGTHGFPPRVQISKVCTLVQTSIRKVILEDCDEGAAESIRFVNVPHGSECECSAVPLEQNHS